MGVVNSDNDTDPRRAAFLGSIKEAMLNLLESGPWDSAVDQLAGGFMRSRLPSGTRTPEASTQASAGGYTGRHEPGSASRSEAARTAACAPGSRCPQMRWSRPL